jgi:hypothetical protein
VADAAGADGDSDEPPGDCQEQWDGISLGGMLL